MWALLVALFGTICWGIAPVFGKMGLAQVDPATGLAARTLFAGTLVLSWLLATGRVQDLQQVPAGAWVLIGAEALLATLVGDLAYYAALKWGNASQVTLVMSAAPLVTLWVALLFLGEELTWHRLVGALLIMTGVVLVGVQPRP